MATQTLTNTWATIDAAAGGDFPAVNLNVGAGAGTPNPQKDDIVVNATDLNAGMSVLIPPGGAGHFVVGVIGGDNDRAYWEYNDVNNRIRFFIGDVVQFEMNAGGETICPVDFKVDGNVGFYGTSPIAKQTGVTADVTEIHTALVNLGLIAA